jgi:hypothetical protein
VGTETLIKQPAESRLYSMDFAPNLDVGETLASVVRVTVDRTGLVLNGSPTYSGTKAFQRIESGSAGTNYKITFVITTSSGNTLEAEGYLQVRDL